MMDVVILAAGMGTRLGSTGPKSLNVLTDGRTIMRQQVDNVRAVLGSQARVHIVVGFKHSLLMEHVPEALFVYNDAFDVTNTNRSLLRALRLTGDGPCVWMNGDVVFDPRVLARLLEGASTSGISLAVQTVSVAEEEVKFVRDGRGRVTHLSKEVPTNDAEGESVGVNAVSSAAKQTLIDCLERCTDQDYFEKAIELAIQRHGTEVLAVDITDLYAVEVDTADDLARARGVQAAALQGAAAATVGDDVLDAARPGLTLERSR